MLSATFMPARQMDKMMTSDGFYPGRIPHATRKQDEALMGPCRMCGRQDRLVYQTYVHYARTMERRASSPTAHPVYRGMKQCTRCRMAEEL